MNAIPKKMMTQEQVSRALNHGERLVRHPWSRFNWIRENDMAVLFASGIRVRCSEPLAKTLCSDAMDMTTSLSLDERDLLALLDLINAGQLVLEQAN